MTKRKKERYNRIPSQNNSTERKMLSQKIISCISAMSIIANPAGALAQSITQGADFTHINVNGNVTTITTDKKVNDTAINVFKNYQLDANNIANMYFGTVADNSAANLVNFVNTHIDINGTVNAIQNNKIGGRLYFLSRDGLAVGATGVINTGSLYVATPTNDYYKKIINEDVSLDASFNENSFTSELTNIKTVAIPLNEKGTITVAGKLHTVNGITLKAAQITAESGALLESGVENFADLVNIQDQNGNIITNADFGSDLTAVRDADSGDIILAASANRLNSKDESFPVTLAGATDSSAPNAVKASVNSAGTIISKYGDVEITATATNGDTYTGGRFSEPAEWDTTGEAAQQIAKTSANVVISGGKVEGQHVAVKANADNSYMDVDNVLKTVGVNLSGALAFNLDAAYAILGSEANVTIEKDAMLKGNAAAAEGEKKKTLDIAAVSQVQGSAGSSTAYFKLANVKHTGDLPSAAVTYIQTDNTAAVNVKGSLSSQGNTAISADANMNMEAGAVNKTSQLAGDATIVNAAVVVANGSNKSQVNITSDAKLDTTAGDLEVTSKTSNAIDTSAIVEAPDGSTNATAVNVTQYDSSAAVNIDAALKGKNVTVAAGNVTAKEYVVSDNTIGEEHGFMSKIGDTIKDGKTVGAIKNGAANGLNWVLGHTGKLGDKIKSALDSESSPNSFEQYAKMLRSGASVGVVNTDNSAAVNISKTGSVSAADSASVKANNVIQDISVSVTGASNNSEDESGTKLLVSAAVLASDITNNAVVNIASRNGESVEAVKGAQVVIGAETSIKYNRINKMIEDVLEVCAKCKAAFQDNDEYKADMDELEKLANAYNDKIAADPDYVYSSDGNQQMLLMAAAADKVHRDAKDLGLTSQIADMISNPISVLSKAGAFASPDNYANFVAHASTSGESGDSGAKAAVAGTVSYTGITNNAKVLIGQNVKIKADKDVNITSKNADETITMTGKLALNDGGAVAVGGTLGFQDRNDTALVSVAKGSQISGAALNLTSDNVVSHTGMVFSAGKAGSAGVSGMLNMVDGDSNSLVAIDDEATLQAKENYDKVDDRQEKINDGSINIGASNKAVLTNIVGGAAIGQAAGIGVSLAINNYDVNTVAGIFDIDNDAVRPDEAEAHTAVSLVHGQSGLSDDEKELLFGSSLDKITTAGISAHDLNISSTNSGVINSISVAGGVTTGDDGKEAGVFDKLQKKIDGVETKITDGIKKIDAKLYSKLPGSKTEKTAQTQLTSGSEEQGAAKNPTEGQKMPSVSIAGAGSASVNLVDGVTASLLENAKVSLHKDSKLESDKQQGSLKVKAEDGGFIGAWSGAAAVSWKNYSTSQNQNNTSVGFAGAVAMNKTDNDVVAQIKNSTIDNAGSVENEASRGGALVAAGLGLSLAKNSDSGGANYSGGASVSLNLADNSTHAIVDGGVIERTDNTDENPSSTGFINSSFSGDTQVTGGLNVSFVKGGKSTASVGAAVTVADLTNDVQSVVKGTTMQDISSAQIDAQLGVVQVGAAVGVGVAIGSGSNSAAAFEGSAAYNGLHNTVNAAAQQITFTGDSLTVKAKDGITTPNKYNSFLQEKGLDPTGGSYIDNVDDATSSDDDLTSGNATGKITDENKTGSIIVTGALAVAGSNGSAAGAAVSVADIDNNFTSAIEGSTITAKQVQAGSEADSLLVGIAAGVAASKNFAGAGSVSWDTLNSNVKATIKNTSITAEEATTAANNNALLVNVAGQVSAGKNGVGAALAYNALDNETGAYILGSTLKAADAADGIVVAADAASNDKLFAIGAGVSAATDTLAVNGTIAINRGANNTEAIIDGSDENAKTVIENAKLVNVNAADESAHFAFAGGVSASKSVAVGGAVAYNDIGGSSDDTASSKEKVKAQINNSELTTTTDGKVKVSADNTAKMLTIGVGVGGSGKVAIQGVAATALVNKDVDASMTGTAINKELAAAADVKVKANSDTKDVTTAFVIAGSGNAAVGAGVAVNRIAQDTGANVSGGSYKVKNMEVSAVSNADILNIGIGGAGAKDVGVAGNVSVNLIDNDTIAEIKDNADVTAAQAIKLSADSSENLQNYVGTVAFAAGGYVGAGLSTSVNEIKGETKAIASDSKLNAVTDLDVEANSTHALTNAVVTGGIAISSSVGVGAAATVAVNKLEGETKAAIENSDVNKGKTNNLSNVKVSAYDNGSITSGLGNLAVGGGVDGGAAFGEASDTNVFSRTVSAVIDGDDTDKNTVNANDLQVYAGAVNKVSTTAAGASVSGGIYGSLSVAGTTSVTKVDGTTQAGVYDTVGTNSGFTVLANHSSDVLLNGVAGAISVSLVGVAAGMGIGVVNDDSTTQAEIMDSNLTNSTAAAENSVKAVNTTKLTTNVFSGTVGTGVAAGGTVVVNNINSKVKTSVIDSNIGRKDALTNGSLTVAAENNIDADFHAGQAVVGLLGGSAAVGVGINTIDSSVVTDVTGSNIYVDSINLTAKENRNVDQYAINASAGNRAIGANILVTNVGAAVQNLADSDGNSNTDIDKTYENTDTAIGNQNGTLTGDNTLGALAAANITDTTSGVTAGRGGDATAQGIQVIAADASLTATKKIDVKASETDAVNMTAGSGVVGQAALNAGVGIMNVEHKTGVTLTNTVLTAPVISLATESGGSAELDMYQGTGGVYGVNAAYGLVKTSGNNAIDIAESTLTGDDISIAASDTGSAAINSVGISGGLIAAGVIIAQAANDSETAVSVKDTVLQKLTIDPTKSDTSQININATKANSVTAHAAGGAVGAATLNGVVATAEDKGKSAVFVGNSANLQAAAINISAANNPAVKAISDSAALAYFASGGASVATAAASGFVDVDVEDSVLSGDTVKVSGSAGTQDGKNNADAKVLGLGGSIYGSVTANAATAKSAMTVDVKVRNNQYKTESIQIADGFEWQDLGDGTGRRLVQKYKDAQAGLTDLLVSATNASATSADTKGLTVGGLFASGNNVAVTENASETSVNVSGKDTTGSLVNNMLVTAAGSANNKATADGSGGALVSGDLAGYAKNTMAGDTTASIDGIWNVNGDLTVQALHSDTANVNADALKATLVGASATLAENTIKDGAKGGTGVDAAGAKITGSGKVEMNAKNNITVGNEEEYGVEGSGYGGIAIQAAVMKNSIDKTAQVDLGDANIISKDAQTYTAQTVGNLTVGGYIKAAGAGAFSVVAVDNDVAESNIVNVGEGAYLKTSGANQDISLAAADNMNLKVTGVADTQGGAVGGASSNVDSNVTRTNKINVDGHLYSMNDVNLVAGGSDSKLKMNLASEAYNKTALAVSVPTYSSNLYQNGQVVIGDKGNVESVAHINIGADNGSQTVRESSYMYTWYYSDKNENYASTTIGDSEIPGSKTNNFVELDGSLTAGVQNKQYIKIGGDGQIIILDPDTLSAAQSVSGQSGIVGSDGLQLNYSSGVDGAQIEVGTMDYGNALFKRYEELGKLFAEYSEKAAGNSSYSVAAQGYKAEQQRIFTEMKDLGLVYEAADSQGNKYWTVIPGMTVDYISLPDIIASGGNISINADNLQGSGKMTAKGAPEINITNNTNLYLKVNDLVVGDTGGTISFNSAELANDGYLAKIKDMNKDKSANVTLTAASSDKTGGGFISVQGNYGGGKIYANTVDPLTHNNVLAEMTPRADIEINGNLENMNGDITIESKNNNILIQGATAAESASIDGKTVNITASNGSISQGFTDGIVNIGGSVEAQYNTDYNDLKTVFDQAYPGTTAGNNHEVRATANTSKPYGNRISGGSIYINASDINVNGYIQSGYANYQLNVDASVQTAIDKIKQNWQNSGSAVMSDALVTTGTKYLISAAGNTLNPDDGTYTCSVAAYYNPSTGKIVVPDIDAKGGQVYLTGRISSTGNGKIVVLDGASDIDITNNTNTDLQVGNLLSSNVKGLISIADTGKNMLTEIRRNSTTVKDLTKWDTETGDWKLLSSGGTSAEYDPLAGLRYNWTKGQSTVATSTYQHTIKAGLWGAVETQNDTAMSEYEESHPTTPSALATNPKTNGSFIGLLDVGNYADSDFAMVYDKITTQNSRTAPTVEKWSTGFLGWFKWQRYTWSTTTGTTQQYVSSVKADKPIGIGFIGNETASVNVASQGNIDLTGNIKGNNNDSVISLSSANGHINQLSGSITGDHVKLNAATGIEDIAINSLSDTVNLSAVNSGSGDVSLSVSAAYGKAGNVNIDSVSTGSGAAAITADGNIEKTTDGTAVKADRIDLVSKGGSIGSDGKALVVHGGQQILNTGDTLSASVNASANKNINLEQDSGNLRLGKVYSTQGDVTLTVNSGDLLDALPEGQTAERESTEELIKHWQDLGLVDGAGTYKDKQVQDVNSYKQSVNDEYNTYQAQKTYYQSNDPLSTDAVKTAYSSYSSAKETCTALKTEYGTYQTQAVYYNDTANIPVREKYRSQSAYESALTDYQNGKAAFDSLQNKCSSYANADAYIQSQAPSAYSAYNQPTVGGESMKQTFDSYSSYQALDSRYGSYASATDYLAGTEAQGVIDSLQKAGAGWSANALLYAVQDAVINPSSGTSSNVIKDPNIRAHNITLHVKEGSVGQNSSNTTTIQLAGLSENITDLKKLANANTSDVKWNTAAGTATITEKTPLGIQLNNNGVIKVNAKNNVYLSGRTQDNSAVSNVLNISNVNAGGDIRLQGNDGIFNAGSDTEAVITGRDLLIQGGNGALGTVQKVLTTDLSGSLQAQAKGGIYLRQLGTDPMKVLSIGAGGDIVLSSATDIVSEDLEDTAAQGYIRSDNGTIKVSAAGDVGTAEQGLRIKNVNAGNADQTVTVNGQNIYLEGVSTDISQDASPLGVMYLGTITADKSGGGTIYINDNGSLDLQGVLTNSGANAATTLMAASDIDINNDLSAAGGKVVISAEKDLHLNKGTLSADKANLTAAAVRDPLSTAVPSGAITQSSQQKIIAPDLVAVAANGIALANADNLFNKVDVWNMAAGDIAIGSSGSDGLTVVLEKKNDGAVAIHNYDNAEHQKTQMVVASQIEANGDVSFINDNGDLITARAATVDSANNGTLTNEFGVKTTKKVFMQATNGEIYNTMDISSITAPKPKMLKTKALRTLGADLTENTIDMVSSTGIHNLGDVTSTLGYVHMTATDGSSITNEKSVTSAQEVKMNADGDITNNGPVTAVLDVNLTANGKISNAMAVSAGKNITMSAGQDITNDGTLTAGTYIEQLAGRDIANNNTVSAEQNISMEADRDIVNNGEITAGQNIDVKAVTKGNIYFGASATAENGNINVTSNEGKISSSHIDVDPEAQDVKLAALNGSVALYTKKGDVDFHSLYGKDTVSVAVDKGNITICSIDGDIILLTNKDMSGQTKVKDMTVGSKFALSGNVLKLQNIKQREGADTMLLISPNSALPDEPIEQLEIGNISTTNGVRFDKLWVKDASVHVDNSKFYIDKLCVVDAAHFSNRDMTTAVYGVPPVKDGSDSVFWNNAEKFNPKDALTEWQDDEYLGDWMNLYFTDRYRTQRSNGILVGLTDYYYVYDQRYSGENELRFIEHDMPYKTYKITYSPDYSYYERFALYELPKTEQESSRPEIHLEDGQI